MPKKTETPVLEVEKPAKKEKALPRVQGVVKWFSPEKGFGFVEMPANSDGSKPPDIFVHYRGIKGEGYLNLRERQEVDFEIVKGIKGPQANDVVVTADPNISEAPSSNDEEEAVEPEMNLDEDEE